MNKEKIKKLKSKRLKKLAQANKINNEIHKREHMIECTDPWVDVEYDDDEDNEDE